MNESVANECDEKNETVASSKTIKEKNDNKIAENEIKTDEKKETKIIEKTGTKIEGKKEEEKVIKTEEPKCKESNEEEIEKENKNDENAEKKEKSKDDISDASKINKANQEPVENKVIKEHTQKEIEKKDKLEKDEKESTEKVKEPESNGLLKQKETSEEKPNERSVMKETSETKKEGITKLKTIELKKENTLNACSTENQYSQTANTTENPIIEKIESRLNPVAPEFKPKNALYVYKKIEKQIKRNLVLLIKSFGYKGIKLENIFGEYCKKYNALLNLNQAGFTSIYDMLKSLEYCLIFEDIKETNKTSINEKNNIKEIPEEEKDKLNKCEKEDLNVEKDKLDKSKKEDLNVEKEVEKKQDKKETKTTKDMEDQNLLIKYKTPKMNEEKKFFVKIVLGTVAECTNYNSERTEEETDSTNCMSLTKLPQEVKKNFGSFFNLKLLQMRYGIDKLQTFLEEIQELEIFQLNNDIKIRITPLTHNSKIPQIKPIKLYMSKEVEVTSGKESNKKNIVNSKTPSTVKNKTNTSKVSEASDHSECNDTEKESSILKKLNEGEHVTKIKSNIYSEEFMNIYNSKFYNTTSDTINKCFVPKILSKSQIHILLFQLIVILFERQQIELEEINRIKEYILSGDTSPKKGGVSDESNNTKETEINMSNAEAKEGNILDFINTSKTNGSSDYMNESIKTYDTSTPFKLEEYFRGESQSKYSEEFSNVSEKEDNEKQEDEKEEGEKFIGLFVSSIKTEWTRFYPEQYPLSFYLNYYKIIKLRKLLEEIPNLIISGFSRLMQVFTLDAAQEYYDKLPSSKQKNLKVFSKFKFTTLSNSDFFNTETYKSLAKSYIRGEHINLTQILAKEEVQKIFYMNNNKGNFHKTNTSIMGTHQSSNLRDFNNYKTDELNLRIKSTVFKNNNNTNNNIEILRYHLHKLLYNLVIHVCKKQNALFTKYKSNGIILSEYEMNRQLSGPFYYTNDLSYEDFIVPKKSYSEKNYMAQHVSQLADYGIHGIKFIHLRNEWFKLYRCDLRPLMKICNYHKIGQMLSSIPSVHVYGEGFDIKYIPNTNMKVAKTGMEGNAFKDLLRGNLKKTSTADYGYQNRMSFQRQAKTMMSPNQNINNTSNRTYDNIMNLLYPNANYQRNNSLQRNASHVQPNYRDINELKKINTAYPNMIMGANYLHGKSNYFKNNSNVCDLFKNM